MKNIFLKTLAVCGVLTVFVTGCYYDNNAELHPELYLGGDCDTSAVISFANDVQPILASQCGTNNTCHGSNHTSGYPFHNYTGVKASVDNENRFLSAITWDGQAPFMPKNSTAKINDCYIAKITKWIDEGALNN